MTVPEIFDSAARRRRRDRAASGWADHAFLHDFMVEGIVDRLDSVRRNFTDVLDLGCADGRFHLTDARIVRADAGSVFAHGGVQTDEDRPAFADASFDLVVSAGVLDTVNDLPGALALARRALRPDGLFLGAFVGAGSLPGLRAALKVADPGTARMHPLVDVRAAGDLLVRAGFALPVADVETLTVRYRDALSLFRDLRGMAASNMLIGRRAMIRSTLARIVESYAALAEPDGRVTERFDVIFLTGWAPDPSQPKPAKRGSATASLAAALKP
ncbi:methyltransferase domain-containing protein [Sphingomonas sp. RS2018]